MSETVKVIDLVNALQLEIITGDEEALQREIKISDISRPGLELTGYFTYYSYNRIQLFGSKEITRCIIKTENSRWNYIMLLNTTNVEFIVTTNLIIVLKLLVISELRQFNILDRTTIERFIIENSSFDTSPILHLLKILVSRIKNLVLKRNNR